MTINDMLDKVIKLDKYGVLNENDFQILVENINKNVKKKE